MQKCSVRLTQQDFVHHSGALVGNLQPSRRSHRQHPCLYLMAVEGHNIDTNTQAAARVLQGRTLRILCAFRAHMTDTCNSCSAQEPMADCHRIRNTVICRAGPI